MPEVKTYAGSCHCGKVRFETKADLSSVITCNCSICLKSGWMLAFVPAEQFTLLSGEDVLSDYQFGKKQVHHLFCSACGVRSFGEGKTPDGREMRAINVRCLEGVDIDSLTVTKIDGKSM